MAATNASGSHSSGEPRKRKIVLTLIDVQPSQRAHFTAKLKRWLKVSLRAYGWRCTQLTVEDV